MGRKLSELCETSGWFLCRIGYKLKERLFWDHSDWNVSFLFVFHAFGSSPLPQAHSGSRISHVAGIQIHQDIIDIETLSAHCCCVLDACVPVIKLSFLLRVFVCTDLFSLFASDLGGYAAREDIEAVLQVLDGEVPASLKESFGEVSKRCKRLHSINLLTHALMQVSCRLMTPQLLSQSAWSLQRFQSHAYKRGIVTRSAQGASSLW